MGCEQRSVCRLVRISEEGRETERGGDTSVFGDADLLWGRGEGNGGTYAGRKGQKERGRDIRVVVGGREQIISARKVEMGNEDGNDSRRVMNDASHDRERRGSQLRCRDA